MGRILSEGFAAQRAAREPQDLALLDERLAAVLEAIEGEESPARLLDLAIRLQSKLALRRQRRQPH